MSGLRLGKSNWCLVSLDGKYAICKRIDKGMVKAYKKYGFLHRLSDDLSGRKIITVPDHKPNPKHIMEKYKQLDFTLKALQPLANTLRVPLRTLTALAVGFSGRSWDFPMYNEVFELIGLKRRTLDGRKWCMSGSRLGVYIPERTSLTIPTVVVEGESDTAAMYGQNYNVIGRPSAEAGFTILCKLLDKCPSVTIVVDNDEHLKKRNERVVGLEGALKLANRLICPVDVVMIKNYKDIRAWINSGKFTRAKFNKLKGI